MYVWGGGGSWSCASHFTCTKLLISFPLDVFSQFLVIFFGGIKNPPVIQETWVQSLGWEGPLEKGMAMHSSILAWRIPRTEATVHGVAKRWTQLSNTHFHFYF